MGGEPVLGALGRCLLILQGLATAVEAMETPDEQQILSLIVKVQSAAAIAALQAIDWPGDFIHKRLGIGRLRGGLLVYSFWTRSVFDMESIYSGPIMVSSMVSIKIPPAS